MIRLCIIIPTYNHAISLVGVVRAAKEYYPVIVVDDGSTDETAEVLESEPCTAVCRHSTNRGKGAALITGFERAMALGFTHAITIDADGQHSPADIPSIAAAATASPEAFVIGVREIAEAGAPRKRQVANGISTFWFRVETGIALRDTQCGFRCYPLRMTRSLRTRSLTYGFELEVLVRAAWTGSPLVDVPVHVDYDAPSSQMSHFRPFTDFFKISCIHATFTFQTICISSAIRKRISTTHTE